MIDCKSTGGQKRINYQKGGGGGAFKRRQGYTTGTTAPYSNLAMGTNAMQEMVAQQEVSENTVYGISSFSKSLQRDPDKLRSTTPQTRYNWKDTSPMRNNNEPSQDKEEDELHSTPRIQPKGHLRNKSAKTIKKANKAENMQIAHIKINGVADSANLINEYAEKIEKEEVAISTTLAGDSLPLQKGSNGHIPKYWMTSKLGQHQECMVTSDNGSTKNEVVNAGSKLNDAITVKPASTNNKEHGIKYGKTVRTMREMKKQILSELMEINNIPACYFVLGKDSTKKGIDIGIEDIVDLVEITTNEDGDIVIRPKEGMITSKLAIRGNMLCDERPGELLGCKHAITVKKIQIKQQEKARHVSRIRRGTVGAKPARQNLTPMKTNIESKGSENSSPSRDSAFSTTLPAQSKLGSSQKKGTPLIKGILKTPDINIKMKKKMSATVTKPLLEKVTKETKIKPKIWHEPDVHLHNHPINTTIRLINEFSTVCFKPKSEATINKPLIFALGRKLGLSINKTQINNTEYLKNKEFITSLKDKLLKILHNTLNKDNEITSEQIFNLGYCKAYIANGNNPMMVRSVLKQRWWWTTADSIENAQLVWTQWKKAKFIESLPCVYRPPSDQNSSLVKSSSGNSESTSYSTMPAENDPKKTPQILNKTIQSEALSVQPVPIKKTEIRMCNHVEGNVHLGNKKALFYNMKAYYESLKKDPFMAIPLTFHIKEGTCDPQFEQFRDQFLSTESANNRSRSHSEDASAKNSDENVWIVKPGENTNRGNGISIYKTLSEIKRIVSDCGKDKHTYIIQKYIEHPLLVNKRKFDIRCYGMITAFNGNVKGYFYKEGYLRTSSREFTLKSLTAKIIHLTNEAVQVKYDEFGKFEPGNKMTYAELNKYIETNYADVQVDFYAHLLPQIKKLVTDSMRASHGKLDPKSRQQTFELFGYDFMIDSEFHVYLIEANINPCLEIKSPVTARIVPAMLDSAFRIAIDPIFQAPHEMCCSKKTIAPDILPEIKHELIYDSKWDGPELQELAKHRQEVIMELEEENEETEEKAVNEDGEEAEDNAEFE